MALSARDKLAAGMIRVVDPGKRKDGTLIGIAPYFGVLLRGLIRREFSPEQAAIMEALGMSPTLAVSRDGILWWSAKFVSSITSDELAGVLVHEAMHLALKHADRATALGIKPEPSIEMHSKARRWNVAGDLAINTDVRKFAALPKDGMFPEKFGFAEGLTAEAYYKLLEEQEKKQQKRGRRTGLGTGRRAAHQAMASLVSPRATVAAARSTPSQVSPESDQQARRGAFGGRAGAHAARDRGGREGLRVEEPGDRTGVVGALGGRAAQAGQIDWRTKLARTIRGAVAYKHGAVDLTWNRVSRRQAGVGFGVGRPNHPGAARATTCGGVRARCERLHEFGPARSRAV